MLILSFDINNVQNPLQRKYRRGQTVLSLDKNLLVGKWNKKKKVFRENDTVKALWVECIDFWSKFYEKTIWVESYCLLIKIPLEENTGLTEFFWSKFSEKAKCVELLLFFNSNSFKRKQGLNKSNKISSFVKKKLKGQYGSNRIVSNSNFLKHFD